VCASWFTTHFLEFLKRKYSTGEHEMKLSDLANFFKSIGSHIHEALVEIFGQSAIDQLDAEIKQILSDDARVIFIDAINAAQSLQTDGAGKRAAAFAQITTDLKAKGISLADSAVNLGIELVVGLLKARAA
jgi:cation transport regulator ChaB